MSRAAFLRDETRFTSSGTVVEGVAVERSGSC
jgi:hypothetical protein